MIKPCQKFCNIIQLLSFVPSNNTSKSALPEFIRLHLLVRENKQGIVQNTMWLISTPPNLEWPLNNNIASQTSKLHWPTYVFANHCNFSISMRIAESVHFKHIHTPSYNLPSINVNPREWIKVNIYRGVNN